MENQDYQTTLIVDFCAKEVFKKISRVADWWLVDFEGSTEKLDDTFKTAFGETWTNFKVIEVIPDKKIVWEITSCYKHWLKNKTEWEGTKLIWEITDVNGSTKIDMTHVGLVPALQCYDDCSTGWNFYVKESLRLLITAGKGLPETSKVER